MAKLEKAILMLVIFLYKGINMNILYYFNAKENKKYIFVYLY